MPLQAAPVVLQLKWQHAFQFAGYYMAQAQGYYREAGLEVEIRPADAGQDPVREVVQGRAHFGVGTSSLLLSRAANEPVVVLGVVLQHSAQVLIGRLDFPQQSVHDLVRHRFMLESQSEELLAYLQREQISPGQLDVRPYHGDLQALLDGDAGVISAYSSYEPFLLNKAGFPYRIYSPRQAGIDFYGDNLFTSEHWLKTEPKMVEAFRAASFKGWEYALSHPEESIAHILAEYAPERDADFLRFEARQIASLVHQDLVEVGYMNEGRWQHIANTYTELGLLPKGYAFASMLYADPREQQLLRVKSLFHGSVLIGFLLVQTALLVIIYIWRTNTRLRKTQNALQASERRYRTLAEEMQDVIWVLCPYTERYLYISPSVQRQRGYTVEQLKQQTIAQSLPPESIALVRARLPSLLGQFEGGEIDSSYYATLELKQQHRMGHFICTESIGHFVRNPDTNQIELHGVTRDITERKEQQERIRFMAQHDALTGLPNRHLFSDRFQQARAVAMREGHSMALIFMDLDHFKPVNDTHGHAMGDALLCAVARRIKGCLRASDIVARVGGDEFLVLLARNGHAPDAVLVAEKIRQELARVFDIGGQRLSISSSLGVALYPSHAETEELLTKCADIAQYQAKQGGRNCARLFQPGWEALPPSIN